MFASHFRRIPVFDPSSPEEAFSMIQDALTIQKYKTPVLFRPTTRVCHAYASIDIPETTTPKLYDGFVKDSKRWVIFPKLSFMNHAMIEKETLIMTIFLHIRNIVTGSGKKAALQVVYKLYLC